jgi:hypothetical protein
MNQTGILLPAMALVGWTLCVLLLVPYQRFKAVFSGQVAAHDFKLGESSRIPPAVSIPNRNFMNLLEVPVLFYFVSIVVFITQKTDPVVVVLAWSYVSLRVIHSVVHLGCNNVMHRMLVFAASNGVLAAIWVKLLIGLVK